MKMRKCSVCKTYTFKDKCVRCGIETIPPQPPKFSLQDRYGELRRMAIKKTKNP
ncbi:MAG: nucleolar RNA-binding Nop10p family protein [Candidatus Aenigmatarchaeota archaeon]